MSNKMKNASKPELKQQSLRDMFKRSQPTSIPNPLLDSTTITRLECFDASLSKEDSPIQVVPEQGQTLHTFPSRRVTPASFPPASSTSSTPKSVGNTALDLDEVHPIDEGSCSSRAISISTDHPETHSPPTTPQGSQSYPIQLDLCTPSPIARKVAPPPKPVYSIFNQPSRSSSATQASDATSRDSKQSSHAAKKVTRPLFQKTAGTHVTKNHREPLFPPDLNSETQHVQGPQSHFLLSQSHSIISRTASVAQQKEDIDMHWIPPNHTAGNIHTHRPAHHQTLPSPSQRHDRLATISPEYLNRHPVLSDMLKSPPPQDDHALWAHRWRPTFAKHVLGNEHNAHYLRDWLQAQSLELDSNGVAQSPVKKEARGKRKLKRKQADHVNAPRIIRAVPRNGRRKRQRIDSEEEEEEDWVVGSDDSFDTSSDIDAEGHFPGTTRFPQLTNTILLHGPVGTGKTAAVYACAEELGWDVFEVYPGIGRRNRANLDSLVGEVGKNHIVGRSHLYRGFDPGTVSKSFDDASPLLQTSRKMNGVPESLSHCTNDFGFLKSPATDNVDAAGNLLIRQSLILFEEVDILYREDHSFWAAVVNILKDCKRPVICTCNDISLIPTGDLPLQTVLTFSDPPVEVATQFLENLCFLEGFHTHSDNLQQFYSLMNHDLRRALHCLQYDPTATTVPLSEERAVRDFPLKKPIPQLLELLSEFDSIGEREIESDVCGNDDSLNDDEIGHITLRGIPNSLQNIDMVYQNYQDFQQHLFDIDHAGSQHYVDQVYSTEKDKLKSFAINNEALPDRIAAVMHGEFYLDYMPYIRHMVALDDEHELMLTRDNVRPLTVGARRATRSNQGYVRTVMMREEDRVVLGSTKLNAGS